VQSFIKWLSGLALSLGGPGLFVVAFLDSSFISLPQINDLLVVLMVVRNKTLMPYYALTATAGSVAGCYVLYLIAERGGEAFLARRLKAGHVERALALYRRRGVLALMVPALLPPPAPFKLFVLLAGVAGVRPMLFIGSIAAARGLRYLAIGALAVRYGDFALELMRTHGREVAVWVAALVVAAALGWWLLKRSSRARS
jgi:membrane protein YqaA with SNARE-associated domain